MTDRIPPLRVEELDEERRTIVERIMAGRGRLPTPFRVWISSPELARRMHRLGEFFAGPTGLSKPEREIVILWVAHRCAAEYVLVVHGKEAREAGLGSGQVEAMSIGERPALDDPRQRAILNVLSALEAPGSPSNEMFDSAVAILGHGDLAEVVALAGYFTSVSLALKLYAVSPPGGTVSS